MKRTFDNITIGLKTFWRQYIFQSLLATVVVFGLFLVLRLERPLITASIGATVFIVFAMPKNVTARAKNVIGGHLIGFFVGFLLVLIPHDAFLFSIIIYSLAIGLSIFIMVACNMEHPPASATALGVAMNGFSLNMAIAFFTSVALLLIVRYYFKQNLQCLVYKQPV